MSKILFFLLITFFVLTKNISYSQILPPGISIGTLVSDIQLSRTHTQSETLRNANDNAPKWGGYISINSGYKIFNFLKLETGLSYQERLPLELFTFDITDPLLGNVAGVQAFTAYPTSPQSKIWDSSKHKRFPNFKYVHLEIIPMLSFGKKLNIELGFGIFYGYLLNHKKLVFTRKDFPAFDFFFEPPFFGDGEDTYHKHDFGWIPKVAISYPLNQKMRIGISAKGYISQYGLKKYREVNFGEKFNRQLNTTWNVMAFGLDIEYKFKK